MTPPPLHVRLLGSAPVVRASAAATLLLGVMATQVPHSWPLAVVAFGFAVAAANAEPQASAYRRWQQDWEAVGGGTRRKRARLFPAMVGAGPVVLYMVSPPDVQAALLTLGLFALVLALVLYAMLRIIRACWGRRRRPVAPAPVAVCIKGPIYPVPSLDHAFAALPDHCKRLLGGRS